jgi:hypothetical protein
MFIQDTVPGTQQLAGGSREFQRVPLLSYLLQSLVSGTIVGICKKNNKQEFLSTLPTGRVALRLIRHFYPEAANSQREG